MCTCQGCVLLMQGALRILQNGLDLVGRERTGQKLPAGFLLAYEVVK